MRCKEDHALRRADWKVISQVFWGLKQNPDCSFLSCPAWGDLRSSRKYFSRIYEMKSSIFPNMGVE